MESETDGTRTMVNFDERRHCVRPVFPEMLKEFGIPRSPYLSDAHTRPLNPREQREIVSLRPQMSPVRDQGVKGTCVAFATVACAEWFWRDFDLSEAHLINDTERRFGDCLDNGINTFQGFLVLQDRGIVEEFQWRYDGTTHVVCPTDAPNVEGLKRFGLNGFAWVYILPRVNVLDNMQRLIDTPTLADPIERVNEFRHLLRSSRDPMVIDFPIFPYWGNVSNEGSEAGVVRMPSAQEMRTYLNTPPERAEWHAVAACGYDDDRVAANNTGFVEFKNSWGTDWGDQGYGYLPYEYLELFSSMAVHGWPILSK